MSFSSLGLSENLLKTLNDHNYTEAYPIQKQAIPAIIQKKDILGIAKNRFGEDSQLCIANFNESARSEEHKKSPY